MTAQTTIPLRHEEESPLEEELEEEREEERWKGGTWGYPGTGSSQWGSPVTVTRGRATEDTRVSNTEIILQETSDNVT